MPICQYSSRFYSIFIVCDTEAKMPTIRKTMKTINMSAPPRQEKKSLFIVLNNYVIMKRDLTNQIFPNLFKNFTQQITPIL